MGTFTASLKTPGDQTGLPATIRLEAGRLSIAIGEEPIGDWALGEIQLEQTPTGYRLSAEGEHILIAFPDTSTFASELAKSGSRKERKAPKLKAPKLKAPTNRPPNLRAPINKAPSDLPVLGSVDRGLAAAQRRWGPLLPKWVFTRITLAIVSSALIVTIVFPGVVSSFLLIAGLLTVVLGAIAYTDPMLASKWLPGRTTPTHALIMGVGILMFGVLLGVIAN